MRVGWTQPVELPGTRITADPLGVRSWANDVAAVLVPGLSNRNNRLQAFGVLCAGVKVAGSGGAAAAAVGPRELWLRFERLWVLAQVAHAADGADLGWPGTRRAGVIVSRRGGRVSLTEPLLGVQLATGLWGGYRRAAATFGLCAGSGTLPTGYALTSAGRAVADLWLSQMMSGYTVRQLIAALTAGHVARDDLQRVNPDLGPSPQLAELVSTSLTATAFPGRQYRALRDLWQHVNSTTAALGPDDLDPQRLTDTQRPYVAPARIVSWLYRMVEQPYRQHVAGQGARPPTRAIWADPAWDVVATYRPQLLRMRQLGQQARPRSWDGVQAWVERLAASRGSHPVSRDNAPARFAAATAPAMSLAAVSALFTDGLLQAPTSSKGDRP